MVLESQIPSSVEQSRRPRYMHPTLRPSCIQPVLAPSHWTPSLAGSGRGAFGSTRSLVHVGCCLCRGSATLDGVRLSREEPIVARMPTSRYRVRRRCSVALHARDSSSEQASTLATAVRRSCCKPAVGVDVRDQCVLFEMEFAKDCEWKRMERDDRDCSRGLDSAVVHVVVFGGFSEGWRARSRSAC